MLEPLQITLLAVAGFLAGAVNGVAGGGSLISFPALLAMGYSPVAANVTSALTTLPGYLGGLAGYRDELPAIGGRVLRLTAVTVAGAACGSAILLVAPQEQFTSVVPVLVLASVAALALQGVVARRLAKARAADGGRGLLAAQFVVSVYGGYFAAGLGVMMLAVLGAFVAENLHRLNALKGALSLIVGSVSALAFTVFGPVQWLPVAVMSVAGLAGGRGGVVLARRVSPEILRWLVVSAGLVLSVALFLR
ncbi:sulfite exporter TauE/SafE family protein [Spongiactinospora rosea]|uniref:Probable membrane transporter protein n=1 Tax=Spongiactinospora rosea TaxID=2248750 RepID=A0A366M620_9ACTN|nr:sulfite exporter TauE/SafE family protein [Spongiactinospora rosea]RBQ21497.1 sulfite exporter TauE/SafE family protein [Spongiactinospora rosea]